LRLPPAFPLIIEESILFEPAIWLRMLNESFEKLLFLVRWTIGDIFILSSKISSDSFEAGAFVPLEFEFTDDVRRLASMHFTQVHCFRKKRKILFRLSSRKLKNQEFFYFSFFISGSA
jgi:hypothetical protein